MDKLLSRIRCPLKVAHSYITLYRHYCAKALWAKRSGDLEMFYAWRQCADGLYREMRYLRIPHSKRV